MKNTPRISESEWLVMRVLWTKAPRTANEVIEALDEVTTWSPKTVKTLLNRLVGKEVLGFDTEGRTYLYRPLVAEADCQKAERQSFLRRVYGGALRPMLAGFIKDAELSEKEIERLKAILDEKGK